MNRIYLRIICAAIVLTGFAACKSGETYEIKMQLNKGDRFQQEIRSNIITSTPVMGNNIKATIKTDAVCDFEVIDKQSDNKQLQMTYHDFHTSVDMGDMGNMIPDSATQHQNNRIKGKSLQLTLSKDNEIIAVTGAESLFDDSTMNESTRKMMKKMFNKEQISNMFGTMFSMYPKNKVAIGESWKNTNNANFAGLEMKIVIKYTLQSVNNGIATISVDGQINGKGKMEALPMEIDMKGTQKGAMFVQLSNGYLQKGNYTMDVAATMEMMGQKIPMTMVGDYALKGK